MCQTKSFVFSSSSGPGARPKRGQGGRVVEVHSQHHLHLQAGPEPYPARRPTAVGSRQGRGLQVPQDQAWQKVPPHRH